MPRKPRNRVNTPEQKPDDEEDLPQPAQVQVFPSLMAEPEPEAIAEPAFYAGIFAGQTAEHDDGDGDQEHHRQRALPTRLSASDQRHDKNAGGKKRRGNPKDRELDMPGAHDVKKEASSTYRRRRKRPVRPKRPMIEITLQVTASAVMKFPAKGSGGQLFVYE